MEVRDKKTLSVNFSEKMVKEFLKVNSMKSKGPDKNNQLELKTSKLKNLVTQFLDLRTLHYRVSIELK